MADSTPNDRVLTDDGRMITLADLPPAGTTRWISRRKADVVAAVGGGLLTREAALQRYNLTAEEFDEWTRMFSRYGAAGLRTTRLRHYRMREQAVHPTLEGDEDEHPIETPVQPNELN
jgi:Protein of unknown function (DUF1153)